MKIGWIQRRNWWFRRPGNRRVNDKDDLESLLDELEWEEREKEQE